MRVVLELIDPGPLLDERAVEAAPLVGGVDRIVVLGFHASLVHAILTFLFILNLGGRCGF
jgi:hypothetical protein